MLASTEEGCVVALGKALQTVPHQGKQFCVFALNCQDDRWVWTPSRPLSADDLPFDPAHEVGMNWQAAFYQHVKPEHTERACLDFAGEWFSNYQAFWGSPSALYVYSLLIPCMRGGDDGVCAEEIAHFVAFAHQTLGLEKVVIGWSNDDRDFDAAWAIKTALADLDKGEGGPVAIKLYHVSIAKGSAVAVT